jgi:hypothetical protein
MNEPTFWKWWTVAIAGIAIIAIGHIMFNLFGVLLDNDATYLSMVILLLGVVTSFIMLFQYKNIVTKTKNDFYWFMSDAVLSLGMIGTLVGFLMVLGQAFLDVDPSNIESMTNAIELLAVGMSTALVTTLVGLSTSLWLKLQLVILESK